MTPLAYLSLYVLGANLAITLTLLFGLGRALRAAGKPSTEVARLVSTLGIVLFCWLGLALFLGWLGIFRSAVGQPVPYIALAIGIPVLTGALLLRGSKQFQEIIRVIPQSWLVGFQFYRVLGVIFLILHAAGLLPGVFALPAGCGDIIVGLTAVLVGVGYAQNRKLVGLWNWFGIGDLVVAIGTGFLTAPSRFQLSSLDAPNYLIGSFPLVMIPIYAVPLSIVLHLASLTKLRQKQSQSPGAARAALT
jgi:hypothetical protein